MSLWRFKLKNLIFQNRKWGEMMQDAIANASFLYLICQITSETVQKNSGNKDKLFWMHLLCISILTHQMHPTEIVSLSVNLVHLMNLKSFQNKDPLWKCITGALIEYFKHLKLIWTDIIDCQQSAPVIISIYDHFSISILNLVGRNFANKCKTKFFGT